jgi:O-antigen ligase
VELVTRLGSPLRLRALILASATAAIVIAAVTSQGAYFSQSWGWVALAFLVPTTVLLLLERVTVPGRLRIAFAAAMGGLTVWIALSALWSVSPAGSVREIERMLVYVGVALALALAMRRGDERALLAGALAGITAVSGYALATRLLPGRFDTFSSPELPYRLAEPIGYWNSLGLLAALGIVLAIGLAAHARRQLSVAGAAATLPILVTTLYFTFSRGAWGSLAVGLVLMTALDPRRLRLAWTAVVIAPASVAAVAIASRQEALTREDAVLTEWERQGHRLALVVAALAVGSALLALLARAVARWAPAGRRSRLAFDLVLGAVALAAVAGSLVATGGPAGAVRDVRNGFESDAVAGADLNSRLFSASGNGRAEQLRVSWEAGREKVVSGNGAGSFEYLWYERRPTQLVVRDGHSLYFETFAELGVVGLALLALVVLLPFLGGVRSRRSRAVPAGLGALATWATASSLDWHWEVAGVTMTAFLVGAAGLLASDRGGRRPLGSGLRFALAGAGVALSVLAAVSLVGNQALFAGREAIARKEWRDARTHADRARTLLPWSHEPEIVLGDAYAGLGDRDGALGAYRDAVETDPRNWVAWLRVAQVASGSERAQAYARVRELNPREGTLPGEDVAEG